MDCDHQVTKENNQGGHMKQDLANKQPAQKIKAGDYIVGMSGGNMRL